MNNERIDLTQFEGLMESIVICEEEYIKGQDSLLEDCQTLKDRMQIILAELKRCYEEIDRVRAIAEDLHAYIVSNADISLSVAEKQMDWVDASE